MGQARRNQKLNVIPANTLAVKTVNFNELQAFLKSSYNS